MVLFGELSIILYAIGSLAVVRVARRMRGWRSKVTGIYSMRALWWAFTWDTTVPTYCAHSGRCSHIFLLKFHIMFLLSPWPFSHATSTSLWISVDPYLPHSLSGQKKQPGVLLESHPLGNFLSVILIYREWHSFAPESPWSALWFTHRALSKAQYLRNQVL